MLVTKYIEIDMGHRVPNHKSKCFNIHGHRYKIEVGVDDKIITTSGASDEGMVIDFGDIKQILMEKIDKVYDHSYTMWENDEYKNIFNSLVNKMKINIVDFIPTAENLARHWFKIMKPEFDKRKINLQHVKVWETPTSTAIYTKEEYNR